MNKKLNQFLALFALCGAWTFTASGADDVVSKAYGIRVYNDTKQSCADVVSFNVDNPNGLTIEEELKKPIRAAAYCEGVYYLIESDDAMVAYRLSSYDMATKKYTVIKEYSLSDAENALIFQCMNYDSTDKKFYAYAFDIKNSIQEGETLDVPFCLYTIDVTTGKTTLIGENDRTQILTLASDKNGILYGIDTLGILWSINKETGMPIIDEGASYCEPSNLQSMAFDNKNNILYWSGFKTENNKGVGFFGHFTYSEDEYWWSYNTGSAVNFSDNTEILGLYIDSDPLPGGVPSAVTELNLTPGENGALEATLSWTNPLYNNAGEVMTEPLIVNIYRDGQLLKSIDSQTPGESGTATITETQSGILSYTVIASTSEGEGRSAYIEGFVGRDISGAVSNVTIAKASDSEELTITWDAPTTGAHNGWFDTASLGYKIVRQPDCIEMASNQTELSFTDATITSACGYSYIITPVTPEGEGISAESPVEFAGTPLDIPFSCDFTTDQQIRMWKVIDNDNDGQSWYPAKNNIESFMKYFPDQELSPELDSDDWLISVPMNFDSNTAYVLKYWIRSQGPLFPVDYNITIGKGATVAAQNQIIKSATGFKNQSMEQFATVIKVDESGVYNIGFQALKRVSMHIKDITIEPCSAIDLSASTLKGTSAPVVGKPSEYSVTISNNGYQPQNNYEVALYDETNTLLASTSISEPLEAFSTTDITITWTPTYAGNSNIYARVNAINDSNTSNDNSESMAVIILENGKWQDVATEGMGLDGVTPFNVSKNYSLAQTIYNSSDLGNEPTTIKGIMIYYSATSNVEIPIKISLANTDKVNFNGKANPVPENEFATLVNQTVSFTPDQSAKVLLFDAPFKYNGTNLCMMTEHSYGDLIKNIYFCSQIISEDTDKHTWYHFDSEPFDFPETVSRYLKNRPSVSFFIEDEQLDGISNINDDANNAETYYYNLQGMRVNEPSNGIYIRVRGTHVDKVYIK